MGPLRGREKVTDLYATGRREGGREARGGGRWRAAEGAWRERGREIEEEREREEEKNESGERGGRGGREITTIMNMIILNPKAYSLPPPITHYSTDLFSTRNREQTD